MAVVLLLGTLSFLFTTPGVVSSYALGVPVLSGMPGQFLLKDVALIAVALWSFGDALHRRRAHDAEEGEGRHDLARNRTGFRLHRGVAPVCPRTQRSLICPLGPSSRPGARPPVVPSIAEVRAGG